MDWIQKWRLQRENMPYFKDIQNDHEDFFWYGFAPIYDEVRCQETPRAVAEKLSPYLEGISSVLEIGAGTGAMTFELARRVGKVTALDASKHMLNILKKKIQKSGVDNIYPLLNPWETAKVEKHDMVIASGCMYAFHRIDEAVNKMLKSASKAIVILGDQNRKEPEHMIGLRDKFGWRIADGRDRPLLYNILYQMGIYPDMLVIRDQRLSIRFADLYQAVDRLKVMLRLPNKRIPELETALVEFVNSSTGEVDLGEVVFNEMVMVYPFEA